MRNVKDALDALADSLMPYNQSSASYIRNLKKQSAQQIADDLSLWGGMGSLMDQGVYGQDREIQRFFESKVIVLGNTLKASGATNLRMEKWIDVFETWSKSGI